MNMEKIENQKIRLGITHGDFNGIGYEIIIKTLKDPRILDFCTPIVYGTSKLASYHRKAIDVNDFSFNIIRTASSVNPKKANLINMMDEELNVELGKSTSEAGKLAFMALEQATDDIIHNNIDVLVTAPINKKNIQQKDFDFPGHTEYLANKFNSKNELMIMCSGGLRVGIATGHVPISKVAELISQELIYKKIKILNASLIKDFGIRKPKIAVLGLNPHAGDNGVLGEEEEKIISPAIKIASEENILAYGPYSSDGFFGSSQFRKFDGIIAMYHDQGLIPFKLLAFDNGVNYTAGLPFVRTSPGHGTAYDLAGENTASPDSFRSALFLALEIYKNRRLLEDISANPLKNAEKEKARAPKNPR